MKSTCLLGCGAFAAMLFAAGCAPKLAQVPLSDEENRWAQTIKSAYPGWQPPETIAPGSIEADGIPAKDAPAQPGKTEVVTEDATTAPEASDEILPVRRDDGKAAAPRDGANVSAKKQTAESPAAATEHVVKPGETLSLIAKKYYRDGNKFLVIYKANQNVVANPNRLKPGTKLVIPALQ